MYLSSICFGGRPRLVNVRSHFLVHQQRRPISASFICLQRNIIQDDRRHFSSIKSHRAKSKDGMEATPILRHFSTSAKIATEISKENNENHENKETADQRAHQIRIAKVLAQRAWPQGEIGNPESEEIAASMRKRVMLAFGLMVGAKGVLIQVPFLFKNLVDNLPNNSSDVAKVVEATTDVITFSPAVDAATVAPVIPVAALLGYGISRATASGKFLKCSLNANKCFIIKLILFQIPGMQELRNAVFSHVAQNAIRR